MWTTKQEQEPCKPVTENLVHEASTMTILWSQVKSNKRLDALAQMQVLGLVMNAVVMVSLLIVVLMRK